MLSFMEEKEIIHLFLLFAYKSLTLKSLTSKNLIIPEEIYELPEMMFMNLYISEDWSHVYLKIIFFGIQTKYIAILPTKI